GEAVNSCGREAVSDTCATGGHDRLEAIGGGKKNVVGHEGDVFLLAVYDFFEVELDPFALVIGGIADNHDFGESGPEIDAAAHGDGAQDGNGCVAGQGNGGGSLDLSDDEDVSALGHDDRGAGQQGNIALIGSLGIGGKKEVDGVGITEAPDGNGVTGEGGKAAACGNDIEQMK